VGPRFLVPKEEDLNTREEPSRGPWLSQEQGVLSVWKWPPNLPVAPLLPDLVFQHWSMSFARSEPNLTIFA
jgi:hypothetical protein